MRRVSAATGGLGNEVTPRHVYPFLELRVVEKKGRVCLTRTGKVQYRAIERVDRRTIVSAVRAHLDELSLPHDPLAGANDSVAERAVVHLRDLTDRRVELRAVAARRAATHPHDGFVAPVVRHRKLDAV